MLYLSPSDLVKHSTTSKQSDMLYIYYHPVYNYTNNKLSDYKLISIDYFILSFDVAHEMPS